MAITVRRRGHARSTLSKEVHLSGEVSWDGDQKAITIKAEGVADFTGSAKHDYTVLIPRRECALILKAIADAVIESELPS